MNIGWTNDTHKCTLRGGRKFRGEFLRKTWKNNKESGFVVLARSRRLLRDFYLIWLSK